VKRYLITLFHPIINSGVRFAKHPAEKRSILLCNSISVIIAGTSLILAFLYLVWFGMNSNTSVIFVMSILSFSPVVLNAMGSSLLSRGLLCVFIPIATTGLSVYSKVTYYNNPGIELDYYTFRFIILAGGVLPAVLFSFRERVPLIVLSFTCLAVLMLHDPIHAAFHVPHKPGMPGRTNYYAFTNIVLAISWCIIYGAISFLKWISEINEERAEKLIENLRFINEERVEKNNEIAAQNQEIQAQAENLNQNQIRLRDAFLVIEQQKDLLLKQNQNLSSELVEKNTTLVETNNELIKHNNELRQFSYTVSHNLRGPVASLLGLINLIDIDSLGPEHHEIMGHIRISVDRLDSIIRDLNKIVDIRHDIFQIRQKINLHEEIRFIRLMLEKELTTHHAEIHENLSYCPDIYSVKPMVQSILYNIISNSIKYRSPERTPTISIRAGETEKFYMLEIEDNGLGIDLKTHQNNLFKLYKRFHQHTEGKGLGLYLVKLQCEALGGYIEVDSELNKFTKFRIFLRKPVNVKMQILEDNENARIFYDATVNATGVIWHGPVTTKQYKDVFSKCIEFHKAYNTPNWMADMSLQGYIENDAREWLFTTIIPEAARNGLKRIVIINQNESASESAYVHQIKALGETLGMQYKSFPTFEKAFDWILEENQKASLSKPKV